MLASRNIQYGSNRPRSGTAGSEGTPASAPAIADGRPPHLRSRSYVSSRTPTDLKPRNATTLPTEGNPSMTASKAFSRQGKQDVSSTNSVLPRIHLPGHKHRQSQDFKQSDGKKDGERSSGHLLHVPLPRRTHSHRHTRSEVPRGSNLSGKNEEHHHHLDSGMNESSASGKMGSGMLARVTSNLSKPISNYQHKPRREYSNSDFRGDWHGAGLGAYTPAERPNLRKRATSDPRAPTYQASTTRSGGTEVSSPVPVEAPPMSEVEMLLLRAEKTRRNAEQNVSEADVQKLTIQLAEANVELQDQLADANSSASSLMRRLDDAHNALLRTASSLIDTISSFQNLCQQSTTLQNNFEFKTSDLDGEMRQTLKKQRTALFDDRGEKITRLEERGKTANDRAEEMSRRLENCRTIVKNYTERQHTKRRAWKGVLIGSIWGCALILLGIVLGFGIWWYKNFGQLVSHDVQETIAIGLAHKGVAGEHNQLHDVVRQRVTGHDSQDRKGWALVNVPDDVREVLDDIASRHNGTLQQEAGEKAEAYSTPSSTSGDLDGDKRLKKWFDKLEL